MTHDTKLATIKHYWKNCLKDLNQKGITEEPPYDAWPFGNTPEMADELGVLVRQGIKTATTSLTWPYDQGLERHPEVGGYSIILDGSDQPICLIQTTRLERKAFNAVDETHAYLEGEGDRSLRYWQKVHRNFFRDECKRWGIKFHEEITVLCERFKLVLS